MRLLICLFAVGLAIASAEAYNFLQHIPRESSVADAEKEFTGQLTEYFKGNQKEEGGEPAEEEEEETNSTKDKAIHEEFDEEKEEATEEKEDPVVVEPTPEPEVVPEDVDEEADEEVEEEKEGGDDEEENRVEHGRRDHQRRPHHRRVGCHRGRCRPDTPRYRVIKEYRGYELRCYPPYLWASTRNDVVDGKSFSGMFRRLFKYIRGYNSRNKSMPMTVPVMVGMKYNITDHKTKSGMRFYLSRRGMSPCREGENCHGRWPPKPRDPKVKITRTPQFCAFVRNFGRWVMSRSYYYYMQLYYLTKDLKRDGKDKYYHKGFSVFAGYDSPWKLWNRRNEVMRIVKCPRCKENDRNYMSTIEAMINSIDEGEAMTLNEDGFVSR